LDYAAALALAYAGTRIERKRRPMIGEEFPEDTTVKVNYLPTLRAKIALLRSNPQQALDALGVAAPMRWVCRPLATTTGHLYPVYVRGEAYLAAHKGKEAAAEFQKILDHRGIVLNEPIGALARLQLGRAYAIQGDNAKARGAYQDFLTLWRDADPVFHLEGGESEYAKLQ